MDLLIPPDRILEPFRLRKAQGGLEPGADVRLTDDFIEKGHEHDSRQLFDERPVAGVEGREAPLARPAPPRDAVPRPLLGLEDSFSLGRARRDEERDSMESAQSSRSGLHKRAPAPRCASPPHRRTPAPCSGRPG